MPSILFYSTYAFLVIFIKEYCYFYKPVSSILEIVKKFMMDNLLFNQELYVRYWWFLKNKNSFWKKWMPYLLSAVNV